MFAKVSVIAALLVPLGLSHGQLVTLTEPQESVSSGEAMAIAERFVRMNGYTDAPESAIKSQLDHESIEWTNDRAELLESRRNTLRPKAIGVKPTGGGWGVAFDYVEQPGKCRVVTMRKDGSQVRMQHQDGIRIYWSGPGER